MNHTPIHWHKEDIKTLIFDWDGTLLDSISPLTEAFILTCSQLNIECPDQNAIRASFGNPPQTIVQSFFPKLVAEDTKFFNKFVTLFRGLYSQQAPCLFSQSKTTLEKLQSAGYSIHIASNKTRQLLEKEIHSTGLIDIIKSSKTPSEHAAKPEPEMLQAICNQEVIPPETCLMIGDNANDILAAHAAGIPTVILGYNHKQAQSLSTYHPEAILDSIIELPQWLKR